MGSLLLPEPPSSSTAPELPQAADVWKWGTALLGLSQICGSSQKGTLMERIRVPSDRSHEQKHEESLTLSKGVTCFIPCPAMVWHVQNKKHVEGAEVLPLGGRRHSLPLHPHLCSEQ